MTDISKVVMRSLSVDSESDSVVVVSSRRSHLSDVVCMRGPRCCQWVSSAVVLLFGSWAPTAEEVASHSVTLH